MSTRQPIRQRADAARSRFERSWAGDVGRRLGEVDFANWITMFGAALLWSAVPLVILLGSLADQRIDDDISRHIGLSREGAGIVHTLFRGTPAHAIEPILTGFLFSFGGVVAAVGSLQAVYERIFGHEPRGWRGLGRWIGWSAVLLAAVVLEAAIVGPVHDALGPVALRVPQFAGAVLFFWWTLHFLLAGRTPWRPLLRPAIASAALWLALTLFSTIYFPPLLISDSHTYGTIGVVFSLLTWFFLLGGVVVLGAVVGAVWEARRG